MTWSTQSEPPPLASLALPTTLGSPRRGTTLGSPRRGTTLGSPTPPGVPKRLRRGMGEFCLFGDPGEPHPFGCSQGASTGGQLEWPYGGSDDRSGSENLRQ